MSEKQDVMFETLKSKLQQNPDSMIFARVADGMLEQGMVDEAIRIAEEGIRKHPYYVAGHMVLGKCYMKKNMFDLAEKEFKRVLLFDPKYLAAHKFTADVMQEAGWTKACEKCYEDILKIDPLDKSTRQTLEKLRVSFSEENKVVAPGIEQFPDEIDLSDEADETPEPQKSEQVDEPRNGGLQNPVTPARTDKNPRTGAPEIKPYNEQHQQLEETLAKAEDIQLETTSINVDEDLFLDEDQDNDEARNERGEKSDSEKMQRVDIPPIPSTAEISPDILDDIFEDNDNDTVETDIEADDIDEKVEETNQFDSIEEKVEGEATEQPDKEAEEKIEEIGSIKVKAYNPNEQPETDDFTGDVADDETIEFRKIDSLESDASENLKPIEDDELSMYANSEDDDDGEDFFDALEKEAEETQAQKQEPEKSNESNEQKAHDQHEQEPVISEDKQEINVPKDDEFKEAVDDDPSEREQKPRISFDDDSDMSRKEKIVTPTLGEIYAAQGQYAKAVNVFELLVKKDPSNSIFQEKLDFLKKRLNENQNA